MARSHARLLFTVWQGLSDVDSDAAKLVYFAVMTEPHTTQCGSGPVRFGRWLKNLGWSEESALRDALDELGKTRKVLIDWETDEFLLRSFIRSDEVWRQPQVLRGGLKAARQIESPLLRHELAAELRRIHDEHVGEVDGLTWEVLANEVPATADVLDGGRLDLDEDVAGRAAVAEPRTTAGRPPARCPKHLEKPTTRACRACGAARDKAREWDAAQDRAKDKARTEEAHAKAAARRAAIDECDRCDADGYVGTALCDHKPRTLRPRRAS
ncbi:hypothetical protein L3Q65_45940 [Amycolatopsis sp. FU40]|uniref:hypothetical protein n=1 Tax=Amycolatopsis sp. FU40 TaxID=2914159 RepID=UPI001F30E921|nr:hypothetical protein [Amycolatopsis sp. FU40]UKD55116.1 hypothetical protein L3Q65_45940 [Amycolatopsis sp. FU40]